MALISTASNSTLLHRWLYLGWRIEQGPCRLQAAHLSHQVWVIYIYALLECLSSAAAGWLTCNLKTRLASNAHMIVIMEPMHSQCTLRRAVWMQIHGCQTLCFEDNILADAMPFCLQSEFQMLSGYRLLPCSWGPAVSAGQDSSATLPIWASSAQCVHCVLCFGWI